MNNIRNISLTALSFILPLVTGVYFGTFIGKVEIYESIHKSGVECVLSTALPPVTEDLK